MSLQVMRADDSVALARFIDVPWHVHQGAGRRWVPPLRVLVRKTLDRGRDPFWRSAERALFIALRDGRPVGRIAAIENRSHNAHHGDRVGFFGFFESVEDPDIASALLAEAESWLAERGLTAMRGPMNPSINHECGLLVEGFDAHPVFMTPWSPPYYARLLEERGLVKERDLLGFWIPTDPAHFELTPTIVRAAERARTRLGRLTFQSLDAPGLLRNAELCRQIFNDAWRENWAFVPIREEEFAYLARELRPLLAAQLSFLAEVNGEPAGFLVVIRDLNRILARVPSGRLFPTGLLKLLMGVRRIRHGRIVLLGIRERYRGQHIFPLFVQELLRRARHPSVAGIGAEASWVLEDNEGLIGPLAAMGAAPYRRWRIYKKDL